MPKFKEVRPIELNKIYNEDCLEGMKRIPDGSIDLTLTSPPYDDLRSYNGNNNSWNQALWKSVIEELYRVTKDGGVVVWIVGDATIKGSETGTAFKQALYFKEIGFNLHDTMIYQKNNPMPYKHNRYLPCFEYMFVFSKGKPSVFNPLTVDTVNPGGKLTTSQREKDGVKRKGNGYGGKRNATRYRYNVWTYNVGKNQTTPDTIAFEHPAIFPDRLAEDHIVSWSNEGDIILDPFIGSGTTAKMAALNNRDFIGFELDETYYNLSLQRIAEVKNATNRKH